MRLFCVLLSLVFLADAALARRDDQVPLFQKVDFAPKKLQDRIDLAADWTISDTNGTFVVKNLSLPFSVHSALLRDKLIENPYYRFNDVEQRWLTRDLAWTFTKHFTLDDPLLLKSARVDLVLDAVNAHASVYLNKKFIVFARNEFLKYEIASVNDKLQLGDNLLEIVFSSPVQAAAELAKLYPYRQPQECPPDVQHGECHVNFLRKQQCSFSWDWGPAMVPVGINGEVFLRIVNDFDFKYSLALYPSSLINHSTSTFILDLTLDFILNNTGLTEATVNVRIDRLNYTYSEVVLVSLSNEARFVLELTRDQYAFELWWPLGLGNQTLYDVAVEVVIDGRSRTKTKRTGFRSVELVQRPVTENIEGLTFYFRINNQFVFMKGSNWIPAHSFQEYITEDYLTWLMESAVASQVNILRVWGGGLYESELFYDLADRLGIMIWQDFMFACSVYPTNADFLENVQSEVTYQLNRLRHRPSIVIWSGNNENEAAVSTNWYGTDVDKDTYANDYRQLYVNTIRKLVVAIDSELSRPFLSSSPTNGDESIQENWLAKNPYDLRYGDLHFYDYKMNGWRPSSFPLPRFMSEYGVQSFPSLSTLSTVYNLSVDGDYYSDLTEHRQHHGTGNQQVLDEIQNNLALPKLSDKLENFRSLIYLSQLNQAMTYKTASELFRRNMNSFDNKTGLGLTMGSMYWQFNDIWQGPTWSTIEFGGKWKMAQYFVKKAYSPVLVSPVLNGDRIDLVGVSDYSGNWMLTTSLNVKIFSYDSLKPVYTQTYTDVIFYAFSTFAIDSLPLDTIRKQTGCELNSANSCVLVTDSDDPAMPEGASNFLLFNANLTSVANLARQPRLEVVQVAQVDEQTFRVDLSVQAVAAFVWLDMNTTEFVGRFSDNGFHMTTPERSVFFRTQHPNVDIKDVTKNLLVRSFVDYY